LVRKDYLNVHIPSPSPCQKGTNIKQDVVAKE
jgi:hypothetical protein